MYSTQLFSATSRHVFVVLLSVAVAAGALLLPGTSARAQQPAPPEDAPSVQARAADAFVESIGVNTHFLYRDKQYYSEFETVAERLDSLGVRYVRDAPIDPARDHRAPHLIRLYEETGIQTHALISFRQSGWPSPLETRPARIDSVMDYIEASYNRAGGRQVIASFEGANEYDVSSGPDEDDWVAAVRTHQRLLYDAVNARPGLAALPVVAPSFVWGGSAERVGPLEGAADRNNMHSYTGGREPTHRLGYNMEHFDLIAGEEAPFFSTETGYHTALGSETDADGGHIGQPGVPEAAQARYVPRMYMEYFRRGVERTFAYEFIDTGAGDDNQEDNFGFLNHDLSPKPAFQSLKNTIAIFEEGASAEASSLQAPFEPGALRYELTGETGDVESVLLQKKDGRFYLVLWQRVNSYDVPHDYKSGAQGTVRSANPASVTLRLAQTRKKARVYKPLGSRQPVATRSQVQTLSLEVPDHLTVVELTAPVEEPGTEDPSGSDAGDSDADDSDPEDAGALSVERFTLIEASTGEEIGALSEIDEINLGALGTTDLSVLARVDGDEGSVVFELRGEEYLRRTESAAPYALAGNQGDDYASWTPAEGRYTLTATPYTENNGGGEAGAPQTVEFTVVSRGDEAGGEGSSEGGRITGLTLVDAAASADLGPLADGQEVDLEVLGGSGLSVRADVSEKAQSVTFELRGAEEVNQTESIAPYALLGDRGWDDYKPWAPAQGRYTLTATPYSERGGNGVAGTATTVAFTVTRRSEDAGDADASDADDAEQSESSGGVVFAMNAGGNAYTSPGGVAYESDDAYVRGGRPHFAHNVAIAGTEADRLYQKERYGDFSYEVPLAQAGTYEVTFQFAETHWGAPGKRVFDVVAEGSTVASGLDVYAEAGKSTAYDVTRTVEVSDGVLNLAFQTGTDNAKLNAVRVVRSAEGGLGDGVNKTAPGSAPDGAALQSAGANALQAAAAAVQTFALEANYPNPFGQRTQIGFALPEACHVRLAVYDMLGREVAVLADEQRPAGRHTVTWEAAGQASGAYFYRLEAGSSFAASEQMILVR